MSLLFYVCVQWSQWPIVCFKGANVHAAALGPLVRLEMLPEPSPRVPVTLCPVLTVTDIVTPKKRPFLSLQEKETVWVFPGKCVISNSTNLCFTSFSSEVYALE